MTTKPFSPCVLNSTGRATLIQSARHVVIYCAPGASKEEVDSLMAAQNRLGSDAVKMILDASSHSFIAGYWGSLTPNLLMQMEFSGSKQAKGLRLGLLVIDGKAWIYTPTPQSLEHELVENAEPNAFSLNEDASRLLIQSLIVPPGTPLPSRPAISPDLLQKTRSELGPNIIIKPQRRRMLEAIRPQMQIVQIEAKGIKLTRRSIELPQNIIRIIGSSDEDINRRIRADWKVFSGDTQRELGRLETQIKNALANIKADHLVHLRRDEYGLLQGDREAFTQAWNTFQTTIVEQFRSELRERVSGMIQQSQEVLLHLLKEHVNDGTLQIPRQRTLFPVSEEELTNYHLQQFIKRIKWPTPDTITSSIDVKCRFYDISEQMLGDPEFLQALEQHFGKLEEWFEMYEQMATPQAPETFGFSMN